jgi:ribosomal protein RSM22 (predicted rRNA methylase)
MLSLIQRLQYNPYKLSNNGYVRDLWKNLTNYYINNTQQYKSHYHQTNITNHVIDNNDINSMQDYSEDSTPASILARRNYKESTRFLKYLCKSNQTIGDIRIPNDLRDEINELLLSNYYHFNKNDYFYKNDYPIWYLSNRFPIEFSISQFITFDCIRRLPYLIKSNPINILDYNSQSNANLFVSKELIGLDKINNYVFIESNHDIADIGKELINSLITKEEVKQSNINIVHRNKLPSLKEQTNSTDSQLNINVDDFNESNKAESSIISSSNNSIPHYYNIIYLTYSLSTIAQSKRDKLLDELWNRLNQGGIMILIEDDTEAGFNIIKSGRQYLLQQYGLKNRHKLASENINNNSSGIDYSSIHATIISPCAHDTACPMTKQSICKFLSRTQWASIPNQSALRLKQPKRSNAISGVVLQGYSYCVIHKGYIQTDQNSHLFKSNNAVHSNIINSRCMHADQSISVASQVKSGVFDNNNDKETGGDDNSNEDIDVEGSLYSDRFHRVISVPRKNIAGEVHIDLCTTNGTIETWQFLANRDNLQGGYLFAQQSKWGDRFPFDKPLSHRKAKRINRSNSNQSSKETESIPRNNTPNNHKKPVYSKSSAPLNKQRALDNTFPVKGTKFELTSEEEYNAAVNTVLKNNEARQQIEKQNQKFKQPQNKFTKSSQPISKYARKSN